MKRAVCTVLLIGLLVGVAPANVNAALLEYDKWYMVSDVMFNNIVFDPQDPQLVYAGGRGGVYVSTDGGDNWTSLGLRDKTVTDIAINPQNPQIIYAVAGGIYKSIDKGQTWTLVLDKYFSCIDVNRSNPDVIYVGGAESEGGIYFIFKSTNGGQTWERKNVASFAGRICPIVSDPTNPNIVYVGTEHHGVYKTTNGGTNWTSITKGSASPGPGEINDIAINPQNPEVVYVAAAPLWSDAGVYKTMDGGENWSLIYYLKYSEPTGIAIDPSNPKTVYTIYSAYVYKSIDGGQTWVDINKSSPAYLTYGGNLIRVNPHDSRILFASMDPSDKPNGTYKMIQATATNNYPARNLKAASDKSQVTLQWEPPTDTSNVAGYYVYRTVKPGKYDEALAFVKNTTYIDKEVEDNQTYYYVVRVLHNDGSVAPASNEVAVTVKIQNFSETMVLKIGSPFMTVNGVKQEIDPGRGTVPVIIQGRTLLPIRAIIEAMGGQVTWNGIIEKVTIFLKNTTITLIVNSNQAVVNGIAKQLDVPPQIINDRTMVPLRFVAENLGAQVIWDDKSQTITIRYNK